MVNIYQFLVCQYLVNKLNKLPELLQKQNVSTYSCVS